QLAAGDFVGGDEAEWIRMTSVFRHPERRRENLIREMRIERRGDLVDLVEIAIDESRQAVAVLDGSLPAPPAHIERSFGQTEVFLHVDQQEVQLRAIVGARLETVLLRPLLRSREQDAGIGAIAP